jgi:hypothetical protein
MDKAEIIKENNYCPLDLSGVPGLYKAASEVAKILNEETVVSWKELYNRMNKRVSQINKYKTPFNSKNKVGYLNPLFSKSELFASKTSFSQECLNKQIANVK